MVGNGPVFSDEPTRLDSLVREFCCGQSGRIVDLTDSATVTLALGADARDDCAVYDISGAMSLVVSSDYVRGPRFRLYELGLLANFDIGYYLVAANVSDIAAMGATPIGVLTVVRYPEELDDAGFREIIAGIHAAAQDFGTCVVGGDIGSAERIILSATALGSCRLGRGLTRNGAKPGDLLCVTGPCGIRGAAVAYFPRRGKDLGHISATTESRLLQSWRRPRARITEGRILSKHPYATSCQDTSDGLKSTIEQLSRSNGLGFEIFSGAVPIDSAVIEVAELLEAEPMTLTMSASPDFQLLFTLDPANLNACEREFRASDCEINVIGRATESGQPTVIVGADGIPRSLPGVPWVHQNVDISKLVSGG